MVEQDPCDHVQPLHVAQVDVVDAIGHQHMFQHTMKFCIAGECWALGVGPQQILFDLHQVFLLRLLIEDLLEGRVIIFTLILRPLRLPTAHPRAKTPVLSQHDLVSPADELEFVPVKSCRLTLLVLKGLVDHLLRRAGRRGLDRRGLRLTCLGLS